MGIDNALDDCQAKPGTDNGSGVLVVDPVETIENPFQILFRYAVAVVLNGKLQESLKDSERRWSTPFATES
jgi:hypothetical protein